MFIIPALEKAKQKDQEEYKTSLDYVFVSEKRKLYRCMNTNFAKFSHHLWVHM